MLNELLAALIPSMGAAQNPAQGATQETAQNPLLAGLGNLNKTPQGQAGLLAFANAALQASQNRNMPHGIGLLNALTHGYMGYKKGEEDEGEKAWTKESRGMQKEEFGMAKTRMGYAEKAEQRAEESHKKAMTEEEKVTLYKPDGSSVEARSSDEAKLYMEKGFTPIKPAPHRAAGANKPTAMELSLIAAGVYSGDAWGLTPQEAQRGLETYKKIFGAQNLLQMLLGGGAGGAVGGGESDPNDMSGKSDKELREIAGGK